MEQLIAGWTVARGDRRAALAHRWIWWAARVAGVYGLGGGKPLHRSSAHEAIYLDANAAQFETVLLSAARRRDAADLATTTWRCLSSKFPTAGEAGPAYLSVDADCPGCIA